MVPLVPGTTQDPESMVSLVPGTTLDPESIVPLVPKTDNRTSCTLSGLLPGSVIHYQEKRECSQQDPSGCLVLNQDPEKFCLVLDQNPEKFCLLLYQNPEKFCLVLNKNPEKFCLILYQNPAKFCLVLNQDPEKFSITIVIFLVCSVQCDSTPSQKNVNIHSGLLDIQLNTDQIQNYQIKGTVDVISNDPSF